MCYLKPLKVKTVKKNIVLLENNIRAYYNKKDIKDLKPDDLVMVFGNLVIEKVDKKNF